MSTLTLRPTSDGTCGCSTTGSTNHYANVDEESVNVADYNFITGTDTQVDVLNLADSGHSTGVITDVTLYTYLAVDNDGNSSISTKYNGTTAATYPAGTTAGLQSTSLGSSFTWSQIDSMTIGYSITGYHTEDKVPSYSGGYVYQQYIVVTYHESYSDTLTEGVKASDSNIAGFALYNTLTDGVKGSESLSHYCTFAQILADAFKIAEAIVESVTPSTTRVRIRNKFTSDLTISNTLEKH